MLLSETVGRFGAARIVAVAIVVCAVLYVGARALGVTDDFVIGSGVQSGAVVTEANSDGPAASASEADKVTAEDSAGGSDSSRGTAIVVHVAGAVLRPGVYQLPIRSRVVDALESAGGASAGADASAVNLASLLEDGIQIYIPTQTEVAAGWTPSQAAAGIASASLAGAGGVSGASGGPVDVNTAGLAELDTLPGIGQVTAGKIVADRTANGPFRSIDDLGRISGIGDAKIGALEGLAVAR